MQFRDIELGSKVRITRVGQADEVYTRIFAVVKVGSDEDAGPFIASGVDRYYYEADGWTVETLTSASGLPGGSAAIMWTDYDHEEHIAFVDGHPGRKVWGYNGQHLAEAVLLKVIGTHQVVALDFRK